MIADAIIVLGGGINNDGSLYARAKFRVEKAVDMFGQRKSKRILFSGKHTYMRKKDINTTEAETMTSYANRLGVPKQDIILETDSMDTLGNLFYCNRIIMKNKWKSIVIVTSDYHVARVRFIAKRILSAVEFKVVGAKSDGKIDELIKELFAWIHLLLSRVPWDDLGPFLKKRYSIRQ